MKYPLSIYILWHPDNYQGLLYAKTIFSTFSREVEQPLQRGIGIPTYFISDPTNLQETINWKEAEQTCVLFLMDQHMIIDEKAPQWEQEILAVYQHCNQHKSNCFFYPIAMDKNAGRFSAQLNISNRLNLYEEKNKEEELLLQIAFKLSTRLYPIRHNERELPVTVFISHARQDGSSLALMVKEAIDKLKFDLTSFIDVKNIGKGENFEQEIENAITESIFLILNTDDYSTREWCVKEILYAKKNNRPILHINAAKNGTKRIFPYLGNIPSIKLKLTEQGSSNIRAIIAAVLLETLRYKYHQKLNTSLISDISTPPTKDYFHSLALPPELLTLPKDKQLIIYPDPPLGNEELSILRKESKQTEFVTPILYNTQERLKSAYNENFLENKTIGVSISENPTLVSNKQYKLYDHLHLQDALVEISRYLLVCGAHCAYGGNIQYPLQQFNFTTILTELIESYAEEYPMKVAPIINHACYPISKNVEENYDLRSQYKGLINFHLHTNPLDKPFPWGDSAEVAIALTDMRKKMFEQNDAQIFIAGKIKGYKGLISGILEEAYWALHYQRPIYIVGAFGGISSELIHLLTGKGSTNIREDALNNYQNEHWQDKYTAYQNYAQELWQEDSIAIEQRIQYEHLQEFFANYWKEHQHNLNNGLSPQENQTLFTSNNLLEITRLILKGLNNFFNQKQ